MNAFELLGIYYALGDGIAWNAQRKLVCFRSHRSATIFKAWAADWTVKYVIS